LLGSEANASNDPRYAGQVHVVITFVQGGLPDHKLLKRGARPANLRSGATSQSMH